MISSKAIFTGRKRISLFFIILFLLIPLYAESYRVGLIIDGGSEIAYVANFNQMLRFSASSIVNPSILESARKSDEKNALIEYEKAVSTAIRNESDTSTLSYTYTDAESYEIEVVPLELEGEELAHINAMDEVAWSYIKKINDLDELYYIHTFVEDGISDVEIFLDRSLLFHFLYSPYVESSAELEILSFFLIRYRGSESAILEVSGDQMAEIFVDGRASEKYKDFIVIPFGFHRIRIVSPTYIPYETTIMIDENFESMEYDLEEVRTVPLYISTIPYADAIYYQGERVEGGYVSETTYPFSLIVNKDGYESLTLQSDRGEELLEATLLPSSLYSPELLEVKKNEMYTNILFTILSFGASVAINVVSDLYSLDYLTPVSVLFQGISVVELIRTVTAIFEYRDALYYGI